MLGVTYSLRLVAPLHAMDVKRTMAYKNGIIYIYATGEPVGYLPRSVFTALYRQGLLVKVGPKKWIIPLDKRDQVTNLRVVTETEQPTAPVSVGVLGVKVGDCFVNVWGYDQTNIDFLVVVRLSASGKTAFTKKCGARVVKDAKSHFTETPLVPTGEALGDREYRMKIDKGYNGEPQLVGRAHFYTTQYWSLCKEGEVWNKTKAQFGH